MAFDDACEALVALEKRRCSAMVYGQLDVLDALISPHLVYTHGTGARDGKQSLLEKLRTGHFVFSRWETTVENAQVIGDTGYIVGRLAADVMVAQQPRTLANHFLSVWHRSNAEWQFCAFQPTQIRPPEDSAP